MNKKIKKYPKRLWLMIRESESYHYPKVFIVTQEDDMKGATQYMEDRVTVTTSPCDNGCNWVPYVYKGYKLIGNLFTNFKFFDGVEYAKFHHVNFVEPLLKDAVWMSLDWCPEWLIDLGVIMPIVKSHIQTVLDQGGTIYLPNSMREKVEFFNNNYLDGLTKYEIPEHLKL